MSRQRLQHPPRKTRRRFTRIIIYLLIFGLIFNYLRPFPHASASIMASSRAQQKVQLTWPTEGSAALGALGYGTLETHGSQSSKPMASLAKLVTALAVLEKRPLSLGQQGPELEMTQRDVDLLNFYYNIRGAYVLVEKGEKISQYQALQAILLPSSNNMADSLALWAFESMANYHTYANDMLTRLGLNNTKVAVDASGLAKESTSTPSDLIALGELAFEHPVINQIIRQPNAVIPVHGTIYSANARWNIDRKIIGIKTGLTDEAGACYLFAVEHTVNSTPVTIIGVVRGMRTLTDTFKSSQALIHSSKKYFTMTKVITAGETFATLTTPWSSTASVVARHDISVVNWQGSVVRPTAEMATISRSLPAGSQVGTAFVASGNTKISTPLILREPIQGPSWQWRMKRF